MLLYLFHDVSINMHLLYLLYSSILFKTCSSFLLWISDFSNLISFGSNGNFTFFLNVMEVMVIYPFSSVHICWLFDFPSGTYYPQRNIELQFTIWGLLSILKSYWIVGFFHLVIISHMVHVNDLYHQEKGPRKLTVHGTVKNKEYMAFPPFL